MSFLDIDKIASLAKLSLEEEEKARLQREMDMVIGYFNQLQKASLDPQMEPLRSLVEESDWCREDRVVAFENETESLLANAPDVLGRLYKTPPIV